MTDYTTSKYQDALTEAAYLATLDGGADEECGDVDSGGWYGLVTLTAEDAMAAEANGRPTDPPELLIGSRVIIRQDSQGFVWTHYGPAHPSGDPAAYRALMAEWASIEAEAAGIDADDERYQRGEGRPAKCRAYGCPLDEDMTLDNGYCTDHDPADHRYDDPRHAGEVRP